jgi:outer membrane protein assembly factor BamE (lipoprotein component of BamABCDE complex)|tara:strand:- start:1358 stop:1756 length:399 start_codon:yes stop_codon:yes gene_type:complete
MREPKKSHGINFLENRGKSLVLNKSNKNDVIKILGKPHITSISSDDTWIYVERLITRGKLIKLGQNVLKTNNVLKLDFNTYGVLVSKKTIYKEDMKKVKYDSSQTSNSVKEKSFVNGFLSSLKQKMYGKRKF